MLNKRDWGGLKDGFLAAQPFNHVVMDGFFDDDFARALSSEFPDYDDPAWHSRYKSPLENKRLMTSWDLFQPNTYKALHYLTSRYFEDVIRAITGNPTAVSDPGLHAGGLHSHETGSSLNLHLDYSIHPKLGLQRHYNLIIYLTEDWDAAWGGGLELWSHDPETNRPKERAAVVDNVFNRAVLFDTTQNSWHGLPNAIACPQGVIRKSMALFYVTPPEDNADFARQKALFAPRKDQEGDQEVEELIKRRSQVATAAGAYRHG